MNSVKNYVWRARQPFPIFLNYYLNTTKRSLRQLALFHKTYYCYSELYVGVKKYIYKYI